VRLQPELGTIQADGSLGELLRAGPVEQMLREKICYALLSATEKGTNFRARNRNISSPLATSSVCCSAELPPGTCLPEG